MPTLQEVTDRLQINFFSGMASRDFVLAVVSALAVSATGCDQRGSMSNEEVQASHVEPVGRPSVESDQENWTNLSSGSGIARLRDFIAGTTMRSSTDEPGGIGGEEFHKDGSWEGTALEIDIVRRKGSWDLTGDSASGYILCVTISSQDGRVLSEPRRLCNRIAVDYVTSTAKLTDLDDKKLSQIVKFNKAS